MITKKEYLEAQKIVDTYKREQINKHAIINYVFICEDCPDGYWYSYQKGKQFNVEFCHYSDLIGVEGFRGKDPNECWKVVDGDFKDNLIMKKHCLYKII